MVLRVSSELIESDGLRLAVVMIPEPLKKTVLIPIKIVKGEPHFFYGGKLPKLKDGTIGDLTVPSYSVIDKKQLALLERETNKVFIPESTPLMVQISPKEQDAKKIGIVNHTYRYENRLFVEIVLNEDLKIKLRSTKKGELHDCKCSILVMPEKEPKSINHVYSIISQHYETHRRSHSGNVFDKVFYWNSNKNELMPLKNLRNKFESEFEQELVVLNKTWYHNANPTFSNAIWSLILQNNEKQSIIYCINKDSQITKIITFNEKDKALTWIANNKYNLLAIQTTSEQFMPPTPPYKDIEIKQLIRTDEM